MYFDPNNKYIVPVDTRRKLNVRKTFRRRPGRLLNVLCTFNLLPVSTGVCLYCKLSEAYLRPCKHLRWRFFLENSERLKDVNYFRKDMKTPMTWNSFSVLIIDTKLKDLPNQHLPT